MTARPPAPRTACEQLWFDAEELHASAAGVPASGERPGVRADEFSPVSRSAPLADRREFLQLGAAALALAGLSGCEVEADPHALPFVEAPERGAEGQPLLYATALTLSGYAAPVRVQTQMGRPLKVEPNPLHPSQSLGTDAFAQGQILELYDPARSRGVVRHGRPSSWGAFEAVLPEWRARLDRESGEGVAILTGAVTSPTQRRMLDGLSARWPGLRRYLHEPARTGTDMRAAEAAFGRPLEPVYRLDRARHVVSFGADPLGPGPAQVFNAQRWTRARALGLEALEPLGLAVAESTLTLTGAKSGDRLVVREGRIEALVGMLATRLGLQVEASLPQPSAVEAAWLDRQVSALRRHGEQALVMVGEARHAGAQALAHRINAQLGSLHALVTLIEPVEPQLADDEHGLAALVEAMRAGEIHTLVILDANPAYTAPGELAFADAMTSVERVVHAGLYRDETGRRAHWHLPLAHPLESWSDARAIDGTASIVQPLVRPLFGGRGAIAVLGMLAGEVTPSPMRALFDTWRPHLGEEAFEARWRECLVRGYVPDSAANSVQAEPRAVALQLPEPVDEGALDAVLSPDPCLWDGRFAHHPWLQELPRPIEKATWTTVVGLPLGLATERGIENGDIVRVRAGERAITGPASILAGQEASTISLFLGGGRQLWADTSLPRAIGYDAYTLRPVATPWSLSGVTLERVEERVSLARSQEHFRLDGTILHRIGLDELRAGGRIEQGEHLPTLYPEWEYPRHKWAMVIDVDACIGCNACVVACQAENNVPTVGREEVDRGRIMHWLRVDRYHEGPPDNPRTHFQPVPCMHCEHAPCEVGCPVNATVHSADGLNAMIYNRCIGTRTCASYCPYKVRRFNWFAYSDGEDEGRVAQRNPEVSVRSRGVMEKCTYCVQRINRVRIDAKREDRPIEDGEVVPACAGACPTAAIRFGDLNDPRSEVARLRENPRHFAMLHELGVRPRTTYLAPVVNDNPSGADDPNGAGDPSGADADGDDPA